MARFSEPIVKQAFKRARRSWIRAIFMLCLFPQVATAVSSVTWLTVGHGWALVRERRSVTVHTAESSMVLDGIPTGADLSSLAVRSSLYPVILERWTRQTDPSPGQDAWRETPEAWVWTPKAADERAAGRSPADRILCGIRSSRIPNDVTLEIAYLVPNMDWEAHYQIAVRGDREDEMEPVSVDVFGMIRIRNGLPLDIHPAVIRLVGAVEPPGVRPDTPSPGFMTLNEDNPLSDLWADPEPFVGVQHTYVLPVSSVLKAHADTDIVLTDVRRKAADRIYSMRSDDFPQDAAGPLRPLNKQIVFFNDKAHGLGFALPPGPVEIFLGGQRSYRLQQAWFSHTPSEGKIRIDLGPAADVLGRRRAAGVSPMTVGAYESDFEIAVVNRRKNDIRVEISEQPSVALEWSVLRAGKPYDMADRRLLFTPDVKAGEELLIDYRLTVQRPQL